MKTLDYIVVGSGCTGAMAAQTLVEAGKVVAMLDVGSQQQGTENTIPQKDFLTLRRTDQEQYRYMLGEKFEGISWGAVGKGEQLTPPRKHMLQSVDALLPTTSQTFTAVESLGYGGLGIGWGVGCWEWSERELLAAGLQPKKMVKAYQIVAKRIGISATRDEAASYTIGALKDFQPSPKLDHNHRLLQEQYLQKKERLRKQGFIMGRTPLAVLTENRGNRKKYDYKEMDFYSDRGQSAYRPWMTVDELRKKQNFTYIDNQLVVRFKENKDSVTIYCTDTKNKKTSTFICKTLVLAPGVLGTARIVLRSLGKEGVRLPILCNPYSYIPCLQLRSIGKEAERHRLGFAQFSFFLDERKRNFGAAMASLYSYQSLLLFRMARQLPFGFSDARKLLQYLTSGIIIMGIHQPDKPGKAKFVELIENTKSPTKDELKITYIPTKQEQVLRKQREKKYIRAMRSMGVFALKRFDPGFGSSIHYAGVLPFSRKNKPYTLHSDGRLHGTKHVFVADGSGFTYLPAKGLTFSLMANAHLAALGAMKHE